MAERLRQLANPLLIVGHANDWIGYALHQSEYEEGGYEACLSLYGSKLDAWLTSATEHALSALEHANE